MKKMACLLVLVGSGFVLGGCATPGYTSGENAAKVLRTWDYEYKQGIDDLLYEGMLTPPSHSTTWNLK